MRAAVACLLLIGAYLLCAGEASPAEGTAAVLAAAPALLLWWRMRQCGERRFDGFAPWLRVIARPCLGLFIDSGHVGIVLLRSLLGANPRGQVVAQDFAEPVPPLRGALVTLAISFAPNSYVLHVPPDGDRLVLHRLARRRLPADPVWPL